MEGGGWVDRQMEGWGSGGYSTVCSELGGQAMNEIGPCPIWLQNQTEEHKEGGGGGLSFSTVPHGLEKKMALHLSVVLLRDQLGAEAWQGRGQRRSSFGARVGRVAQDAGCGYTPLLLPPRAKGEGLESGSGRGSGGC